MHCQSHTLALYAVFYARENNHALEHVFRHFVITDLGNDHLPWPYIVEQGIYMELAASGSLFDHDFIRAETLPIYLTPNLWTCRCPNGPFIHDLTSPSCPRCRSFHARFRPCGTLTGAWQPHINRYPYWNAIIAETGRITASGPENEVSLHTDQDCHSPVYFEKSS